MDIQSALFLEQAALCYAQNEVPMMRKYAFYLILSGHRFSKCNLRDRGRSFD